MAAPALLDSAELLRLHGRVLAADAGAGELVAAFLIETCSRNVRRVQSHRDPAAVQDSVEDAVLYYLDHPSSYDPGRASLTKFIERAASRNLIDWQRAERARHAREATWAAERARVANPDIGVVSTRTPYDVWPFLFGSRGPLTDLQWRAVEFLFPPKRIAPRGKPPGPARPILDGVIAMLRQGRCWKDLPDRYPPYPTCYRHFRAWSRSGILRDALDRLEAEMRRPPGPQS